MARTNRRCAKWVVRLMEPRPDAQVLEVGFGPGIGIEFLVQAVPRGAVSGIDSSDLMCRSAVRHNRDAVAMGRVTLRQGAVENIPFPDESFDGVMAINSFQAWGDTDAGLAEIMRVLRPQGTLALGFNPHARQPADTVCRMLERTGFIAVRLEVRGSDFCVLAGKPAG